MANQIKKKESAEIVDINLLLSSCEAGHNVSNEDNDDTKIEDITRWISSS